MTDQSEVGMGHTCPAVDVGHSRGEAQRRRYDSKSGHSDRRRSAIDPPIHNRFGQEEKERGGGEKHETES